MDKILIVSQSFYPDPVRGAEKVAMSVAQAFKDKYSVHVLALGEEDGVEDDLGYPVHRLTYNNGQRPGAKGLDLGPVAKLAWHARNSVGGVNGASLTQRLKDINPSVVYIHNATGFQPQLFQACASLGLPVVQHLHDYASLCPRTTMYKKNQNCATPCLSCRVLTAGWRPAFPSVGDVIAVSAFVRDRHIEHGAYRDARWHVLHNTDMTSVEGYTPKATGPFTFGFIGAVTEAKGIEDLLTAFTSRSSDETRLLIAGKGEDAYLRSLQAKFPTDTVRWLGQVPPDEFYSNIDCLVVPSRWHEPQGLVIVEGLRRGLPIIATQRGGIPEMLADRSEHRLYNPDAPDALASAMNSMIGAKPTLGAVWNDDFIARVEAILLAAAVGKQ